MQPNRLRNCRLSGFTLVEVLMVLVVLAVVSTALLPQLIDGGETARHNLARFNLRLLRGQIALYRSEHDGRLPSPALVELVEGTNEVGDVGSGSDFPCGPYFPALPVNPITGSRTVRLVSDDIPVASGASDAGWLYDPGSGKLWLDDARLLHE